MEIFMASGSSMAIKALMVFDMEIGNFRSSDLKAY